MSAVDDGLIRAWLAARSLSRGLPAPVADHGGWRVDSEQSDEIRRYLFSQSCNGLRQLGETINEPLIALKLCASPAELLAQLPARWRITSAPDTHVMVRSERPVALTGVPDGFGSEAEQRGDVGLLRILYGSELAASGYVAELDGVFIYDRIRVEETFQRRGLGRALMAALGQLRRSPQSREILTATPMGRALYLQLGWHDYAEYSTAMIPQVT